MLIFVVLMCAGLFKQVQWSTCSEGESTETGSGNFGHQVTYQAYFFSYVVGVKICLMSLSRNGGFYCGQLTDLHNC